MSTIALLNCFSYVDGHDFTADTNQANLAMEAAALDRTTFRSNKWAELAAGLKSSTFDESGFFQAGDGQVDPEVFNRLGQRNRVHTFGPEEVEGGPAYMWKAGQFTYSLLGTIGEMAPFSVQAQGTDSVGVVRGRLAKALGDVSATGVLGSPVNLGAGAEGEYLYLTFHVFSAGTSISVKVESASDQAFTAPTDVASATLGPITAAGGTWMSRIDASAFTDPWYRLNVVACTGTFSVAAALAIQ
ncbi:hypothetical protein BAY59_24300 [Prauserella coralliicola]|nr:hypothetical protein BAY59_24300 [Prauserella coralliicola]